MPELFPPVEERAPHVRKQPPEATAFNWIERVKAQLATEKPAPEAEPSTDREAGAIGDDFVWNAPFVDQYVRKFFRKHWKEYTEAIRAAVNEQMPMEKFGLDFGPKRISDWINTCLCVRDDHPNPCAKQNVNASAAYTLLVKAFKRNPREHVVIQRLQQGRSRDAQAILDEFLSGEGCDS